MCPRRGRCSDEGPWCLMHLVTRPPLGYACMRLVRSQSWAPLTQSPFYEVLPSTMSGNRVAPP
jgi:hypothetical protein